MAAKFRKRMPSEKHYDRMLNEALARFDASPYYSEEMAVEAALQIVRQRREADRKAIGLPAHWPAFETPLEHSEREIRIRADGTSRDDAVRAMFLEDLQVWRQAEPTWSAQELANHISDRGFYTRNGWAWCFRLTQEALQTQIAA